MQTNFDQAASTYDATFTHTKIGRAQRDIVYEHITRLLSHPPKDILEINCGTGEDAIWFEKRGFNVLATDISSEMIARAKSKMNSTSIEFVQADINQVSEQFSTKKFDVVFSNFGGLNCLTATELEQFFLKVQKILSDKGRLILVIMPKNTLWEKLYFILKGKGKEAFRRTKEVAFAKVEGAIVPTYYYNPKDIERLAHDNFERLESKPIGFFIPPSYLEPFFKKRPRLFQLLVQWEKKIRNKSALSKYSDHYLLVLQKR